MSPFTPIYPAMLKSEHQAKEVDGMRAKSKISHLLYQDSANESNWEIDMAIVRDWNKKFGIYDYQAKAYVIEPEYDNIFEIGRSAFVVCKSAMQSLWVIREAEVENAAKRFRQREVRRITDYDFDNISMEKGFVVASGHSGGNRFFQAYSLVEEWLSEPCEWISVISFDLLMATTALKTVLANKSGRVLWEGESPSMITPTDITLSGDGRYPVFFDMADGTHLWPVFQAVPIEDYSDFDEEADYSEDNSFDLQISKYMRSKQEPKWCEEMEVYCPVRSGHMLGHTRY